MEKIAHCVLVLYASKVSFINKNSFMVITQYMYNLILLK
jgi:hypothetical protein